MKKLSILTIFLFTFGVLFTSCGGADQDSATEEESTTMTEDQEMEDMSEELDQMEEESDEMESSAEEGRTLDLSNEASATLTVETPGTNMQEMRFDVKSITLKAGQTVNLTLNNTGEGAAMQHNLVVIKGNSSVAEQIAMAGLQAGPDNSYVPENNTAVVAKTKILKPGESETITFTMGEAGEYMFICTYPGHWQKMQGTITVK